MIVFPSGVVSWEQQHVCVMMSSIPTVTYELQDGQHVSDAASAQASRREILLLARRYTFCPACVCSNLVAFVQPDDDTWLHM